MYNMYKDVQGCTGMTYNKHERMEIKKRRHDVMNGWTYKIFPLRKFSGLENIWGSYVMEWGGDRWRPDPTPNPTATPNPNPKKIKNKNRKFFEGRRIGKFSKV